MGTGAIAVGEVVVFFIILILIWVTVSQVPQATAAALVPGYRRPQQLFLGFLLSAAFAGAPAATLLFLRLLRSLLFGFFAAFPFHSAVLEPNLHLQAQVGVRNPTPASSRMQRV